MKLSFHKQINIEIFLVNTSKVDTVSSSSCYNRVMNKALVLIDYATQQNEVLLAPLVELLKGLARC